MERLLAFVGGIVSGGAIGTAGALLLTPISGEALRNRLGARWDAAKQAGEIAAAQKRLELEARLYEITGPHPPNSPMLNSGSETNTGRSAQV